MSTPRIAVEERSIDRSSAHQPPIYRDQQLGSLMKLLRATVRPHPPSRLALEKVEQRLRYVLRCVEQWDTSHARRARELIMLGCIPAANGAATMIFDQDLRQSLLRQCFVGNDGDAAAERVLETMMADREVLG